MKAGFSRLHQAEYRSWWGLRSRCANPDDRDFKYYGARGISVCERWRDSFENFLADMGPRPNGTTIDRIDNNGNYEPGNCRWATKAQQSRNTRGVKLTVEIATAIRTLASAGMPIDHLAQGLGLHPHTIGAIVRGESWMPIA